MFYIVAGICSFLFFAVVFGLKLLLSYIIILFLRQLNLIWRYFIVFQAKPPLPPSASRIESDVQPSDVKSFYYSVKRLLLSRSYVLLLITYGNSI